MKDTNLAMASRFLQLIMAKTEEERLIMGCSMFDAAKQIVRDAIIQQHAGMPPREIKKNIFLRFYGMDFNKIDTKRILKVLK